MRVDKYKGFAMGAILAVAGIAVGVYVGPDGGDPFAIAVSMMLGGLVVAALSLALLPS